MVYCGEVMCTVVIAEGNLGPYPYANKRQVSDNLIFFFKNYPLKASVDTPDTSLGALLRAMNQVNS